MKTDPIRVLLVEDSPTQAKIVSEALAAWKFQVFEINHAVTLERAQSLLQSESFDAVLLDLTLPDSSGEATFDKLHDVMPDLPIVVLTSLEDEDISDRIMHRGAQEFLQKSEVSASLLPRVLRHAIERRHIQRELEDSIAMMQQALSEVNAMSGVIPICAGCKKIRNDKGYWDQVEAYISRHTLARFSHSLCPDCMTSYYPDLLDDGEGERL